MRRSSHSKPQSKSQAAQGELFVVATPIGNLGDITLRALETLKSVDLIACEDTRTSGTLLMHYGIRAEKFAYHTHNEAKATVELLTRLQEGKRIALISDAGTPLVSDPGARLVRAAIEAGIRVTPIPGASALLCALTMAGLPTDQFLFVGFLPSKSGERRTHLNALREAPYTLVFYEAPHRVDDTLADIEALLGNRRAALARELTKLHETCERNTLSQLRTQLQQQPARGEYVIIVEGAAESLMSEAEIEAALKAHLATHSLREAVDAVTAISKQPRSEIYARALALKATL